MQNFCFSYTNTNIIVCWVVMSNYFCWLIEVVWKCHSILGTFRAMQTLLSGRLFRQQQTQTDSLQFYIPYWTRDRVSRTRDVRLSPLQFVAEGLMLPASFSSWTQRVTWQKDALTLSMKYRATARCRTFISLDFQSSRYWFRILSTHFFSLRAVSYFCQSFSPYRDPTTNVDCLGMVG